MNGFSPPSVFRQTAPQSGEKPHEYVSEKARDWINQRFLKIGGSIYMEKLRRLYGEMTRSQKKDLHRILTGAGIFILGEILAGLVPFLTGTADC